MIDLHCHLLPGIDDGANTLDQALAMAGASVDNGIRYAVMTPHLHPGRYENTRSVIQPCVDEFRTALQDAGIPLKIGMAAEVRVAPEILVLLERDEVPFLGEMDGYRILLLELPHTHIPPGIEKFVDLLMQEKIRPLIAHPERNRDVISRLSKIEPLTERGCLLQITAASLVGIFGKGPLLRARELLHDDACKVLATDAHNLDARRPLLKEGLAAASEILGKEAAHDLVHRNPLAILGLADSDIANDNSPESP
jgi:protein-tyrosine phosphatase